MSDKDSSERGEVVRKSQGQSTMTRKTEIKLKDLFDLVRADYKTNEYKEDILRVNLKHLGYLIKRDGSTEINGLAARSAVRLETRDFEFYKADREKEGASKSTIQLELNTLKRAYTLGLEKEYIKAAPKVPRYGKKVLDKNIRKGFFEHDQYQQQLDACRPYVQHCLRFNYAIGWRVSELFKLTWAENYVDSPPHIRIYKSKNGEGRVLPLLDAQGKPTELYQVIQERLSQRIESCPYIFHYEGRKLNRVTFSKHWREACKKSGVRRYFHDLRRTANRNMKNNGVDQQDRMTIIGHKTVSMDLRYGITNEHDIKVALGKVFRSHSKLSEPKNGNTPEQHVSSQTLQTEVNQEVGGESGSRTHVSDHSENTLSRRVITRSFKYFIDLFTSRSKKDDLKGEK